jgi:hypothetical protein
MDPISAAVIAFIAAHSVAVAAASGVAAGSFFDIPGLVKSVVAKLKGPSDPAAK